MNEIFELIYPALIESTIMIFGSGLIAAIFGLIIGIILVLTKEDGLSSNIVLNKTLNTIIDFIRAVPFIILLVFITPLTRLIMGTSIGIKGSMLPLIVSATAFFSRLIESNLIEVDSGKIEAAKAAGATKFQIVKSVLVNESLPSIVRSFTNLLINIVGYSAMAGAIGGGGLGDLAIRYGYYLNRFNIMVITVIIIVILVNLIQILGTKIADKMERN